MGRHVQNGTQNDNKNRTLSKNDSYYYDTQYSNTKYRVSFYWVLHFPFVMLCRYAECCYAESRGVNPGADLLNKGSVSAPASEMIEFLRIHVMNVV